MPIIIDIVKSSRANRICQQTTLFICRLNARVVVEVCDMVACVFNLNFLCVYRGIVDKIRDLGLDTYLLCGGKGGRICDFALGSFYFASAVRAKGV